MSKTVLTAPTKSSATTNILAMAAAFMAPSSAMAQTNIATGTGAVAQGNNSTATGQGAVATGNSTTANGDGTVAQGDGSTAQGDGSVALGKNSSAQNTGDIAVGTGALANGGTDAFGGSAIAVGISAKALARIIHPVEFRAPSFEHLASAGHT